MWETVEDAALSGDIRREISNFPLALQHNLLYKELKGKTKLYICIHKHTNAGEGRETPVELSPAIANSTHPWLYG